jgi:hypothetical protein
MVVPQRVVHPTFGASGGGAQAPGMEGIVAPAGREGVEVGWGHPACHQPGQAEQTATRGASVGTFGVSFGMTWRPGRRPAPTSGGSTADGMAWATTIADSKG